MKKTVIILSYDMQVNENGSQYELKPTQETISKKLSSENETNLI
jgi:hypothetical protein